MLPGRKNGGEEDGESQVPRSSEVRNGESHLHWEEICDGSGITNPDFNHLRGAASIIPAGSEKFQLGYEAVMGYLDYVELQEARASAKQARSLALWAIGISAFLALASILLTVYSTWVQGPQQLEELVRRLPGAPPYLVTLSQDQIEELKSAMTEGEN